MWLKRNKRGQTLTETASRISCVDREGEKYSIPLFPLKKDSCSVKWQLFNHTGERSNLVLLLYVNVVCMNLLTFCIFYTCIYTFVNQIVIIEKLCNRETLCCDTQKRMLYGRFGSQGCLWDNLGIMTFAWGLFTLGFCCDCATVGKRSSGRRRLQWARAVVRVPTAAISPRTFAYWDTEACFVTDL